MLVSEHFCILERSWKFEERCTAILFGTTMVMAVYAPDSSKSRASLKYIGKDVGEEPKTSTLQGICVELGMKDIDGLTGIYGPLCWQGCDRDLGGFKKILWDEILKEFNCKASSTRSVYGREREDAFTHRHLSPGKKEETSQLDYIIGPMRRDDEICIHNEERKGATRDHLCKDTEGMANT